MHYFCLFDTDGKTEVVACIRELVKAALHGSPEPAFRAQSSANTKTLMMSVMVLADA